MRVKIFHVASYKNPYQQRFFDTHLKACKIFRDGPLPGPFAIDAGARIFNKTTLTILHRKSRLSSIDRQTGATSTFVNVLSFIQHLRNEFITVVI